MSRKVVADKIQKSLKKLSKENKNDLSFNELRIVVALERLVARLEADMALSKHLVYKGGFVLLKSYGSNRFTRDLDALGLGMAKEEIKSCVPVAISKDLNDGLWFGEIKCVDLVGQGDYGGLRFNLAFQIGDPPGSGSTKRLSRLHFDVGFGDFVDMAKPTHLESILDRNSKLTWKVYPPEFIFSEKLQTFVHRGDLNSRAKDIYDMVGLYEMLKDKARLKLAIEKTFQNRDTEVPSDIDNFAKQIDLDFIKGGWKSVSLLKEDAEFSDYWDRFLVILGELKVVLNK